MNQPQEITITINENKAVTTESIRLYKEMMREAVRSVVALVQVNNNIIDFTIAKIERPDMLEGYYECHIVINNQPITFEVNFPSKLENNYTEAVYKLIIGELSKKLFELIMPQIIRSL